MPLGSLQKGSFDVSGAQVEVIALAPSTPPTPSMMIGSHLGMGGIGGDTVSLGGVSFSSNHTNNSGTLQNHGRKPAPEWLLRIKPANQSHPIELGVESKEDAIDWSNIIKYADGLHSLKTWSCLITPLLSIGSFPRSVAQRYTDRENMHREIEMTWRIAKELSDIIVYCRAVAFSQERILRDGRNPQEMSSFPEQKAEKVMLQEYQFFLWYHQVRNSP